MTVWLIEERRRLKSGRWSRWRPRWGHLWERSRSDAEKAKPRESDYQWRGIRCAAQFRVRRYRRAR